MPLYEYKCRQCDTHFEKIQKFSDPPIKTCEICGGRLDQVLSSPAIQFKGTGWYITDYARKSSGETPSKGSGEAASKGDGAAPSKTESKPTESKAPEPSKKA